MTKLGIVAALLVLGAVGCTKKDEESGKPAGLPPLSAGPPPPSPPAPPQAPAVPPPGATTAQAPQAAPPSPGASITGEITLASSLRAKVTPSDTVFLVARR